MKKFAIAVLGILAASLLSSNAFAFSGDHARGVQAGSHVVKAGYRHHRVRAYRSYYYAPCYRPRCYRPCYNSCYTYSSCNSYYSPYYGGGCYSGTLFSWLYL
jgi:hypothetical protein